MTSRRILSPRIALVLSFAVGCGQAAASADEDKADSEQGVDGAAVACHDSTDRRGQLACSKRYWIREVVSLAAIRMVATPNPSTIIVSGQSTTPDPRLVWLNDSGDVTSVRGYPGFTKSPAFTAIATNGQQIAVGFVNDEPGLGLALLDLAGDVVWRFKSHKPGKRKERANELDMNNVAIAIAAMTWSDQEDEQYSVYKVSLAGEALWRASLEEVSSGDQASARDVVLLPNGGVVACGSCGGAASPSGVGCVWRLDAGGTLLWNAKIPRPVLSPARSMHRPGLVSYSGSLRSMALAPGEGYLLVGEFNTHESGKAPDGAQGERWWTVAMNDDGHVLRSQIVGDVRTLQRTKISAIEERLVAAGSVAITSHPVLHRYDRWGNLHDGSPLTPFALNYDLPFVYQSEAVFDMVPFGKNSLVTVSLGAFGLNQKGFVHFGEYVRRVDQWGYWSYHAAGLCAQRSLADCDDHDPCTRDRCRRTEGCVHDPWPDETPCGVEKVCRSGECVSK